MSQLKQEVNKNKLIDIKKENLKKLKKSCEKKEKVSNCGISYRKKLNY
jgi:hypothetical protein